MTWPFGFTAKTDGVDDHLAEHVNDLQDAADDLAADWIPISDTWSYASASTITIPSDGTQTYAKGMRIRFKQGGGFKYFVAVTVTSTLLTIAVNNDYTVANSAITDISISFAVVPVGYPEWFSHTPTVTGYSAVPTTICRYKITGNTLHYKYVQSTFFTSNATTLTISIPVTAKNIANYFQYSPAPHIRNNGTLEAAGYAFASPNSNTLTVLRSAGAAWTNSGNKDAAFAIDVEF